jgi:hypothetical protein
MYGTKRWMVIQNAERESANPACMEVAGIGPSAAKARRDQSSPFVHLADMTLSIEFKAEPCDEVELGLEEIDVVFLVHHQLLEQVARYIILRGVAMRPRRCAAEDASDWSGSCTTASSERFRLNGLEARPCRFTVTIAQIATKTSNC